MTSKQKEKSGYPICWIKWIEPHLEWKFDGNLFHQTNGVWVPATINSK